MTKALQFFVEVLVKMKGFYYFVTHSLFQFPKIAVYSLLMFVFRVFPLKCVLFASSASEGVSFTLWLPKVVLKGMVPGVL